jgi:hypothetical protein
MQAIDSLLSQLDGETDLDEIRAAIADLIKTKIEAKKASLGYWELAHFTNAIGSLSLNVNSPTQPTYAGLRVCLLDLKKAISPEVRMPSEYDAIRKLADPISPDLLIESLSLVCQKISAQVS